MYPKYSFTIISYILVSIVSFYFYVIYSPANKYIFCNEEIIATNGSMINNKICIACPNNAHCSNGRFITCYPGLKPIRISNNPLKYECVIDNEEMKITSKYIKSLKNIIAQETGKFKCKLVDNYDDDKLLHVDSLKMLLRKKFAKYSQEDFDKYFELAVNDLKDDNDVEIYEKLLPSSISNQELQNQIHIISNNPKYSIKCALILIVIIIMSLHGTINRWSQKSDIDKASKIVIRKLKENRIVKSLDLRDPLLGHITNIYQRQKMWSIVEDKTRNNPYVRANKIQYTHGRTTWQWEWIEKEVPSHLKANLDLIKKRHGLKCD
ncbi:10768_t:CDS:2 [Entrophospora sp. SA101]|nr:10750_t:CDS:2 [Entrophospora sp. SA101]CAJ0639158.1 10768_t:CDS:2 [Entrophospora sp. SA101]CAJ0840286.1 1939_t:CDS:2 [Entrophospora sp. SA101]